MRHLTLVGLAILASACAGGSGGTSQAPKPASTQPQAPSPAAQQVMRQAAAAEPPKPKDIDPTGNYNASLTYGGTPISVYVQLTKKADGSGYAGTMSAEGTPPIQLTNIKVSGKTLTANLTSPDGSAVSLDLVIDGDVLSGSWKSNSGDGSAINGRRVP